MKPLPGALLVVLAVLSIAGCSGAIQGPATPSISKTITTYATMDPWERVGADMQSKPDGTRPNQVAVPAAAPAHPAPKAQ